MGHDGIAALRPWEVRNRAPNSPLFGLCAFETYFRSDRSMDGAMLAVRIGSSNVRLGLSDVVAPVDSGVFQLIFHVNTHRVSNGIQELRTEIVWPDGETARWQTQEQEIDNVGSLATVVADDLEAYGTPTIFGRVVDSSLFPYEVGRATAWFNEEGRQDLPELSFSPARDNEAARRHLARWGFCVLNARLPPDLLAEFNREIDDALEGGQLQYNRGSSDRVYGAHKLPHGRQVWLFAPVVRFLRDWFRDEPCACQSLLYINGSEQNAHQDTIHLTPYPAGYMCGVWMALEDVQNDSGELFVYPGSQRTSRLTAKGLNLAKVTTADYSAYAAFDRRIGELVAEGGYQSLAYRPKAGEILIWHENLVHGGSRRLNPSITRRSIVGHYFARGGVAYYDSRGEAATLEAIV